MKKITNLFGFLLTILLGISFFGLFINALTELLLPHQNISILIASALTFALIISLCISIIYLLVGIVVFIGDKMRKKKTQVHKKFIVRGLCGFVVNLVLFFLLNIVVSIHGLEIGHKLPYIPDSRETSTGFPLKDLQIVRVRQLDFGIPHSDRSGRCEVTIKNNNPLFIAVQVKLSHKKTDNWEWVYSYIRPQSIVVTKMDGDYSVFACTSIIILNAGIYK